MTCLLVKHLITEHFGIYFENAVTCNMMGFPQAAKKKRLEKTMILCEVVLKYIE